jgi:replication factor A1
MHKNSYKELMEKIVGEGKITLQEAQKRVEEKRRAMGGLLSEEGAAYIVAKELGIRLPQNAQKITINIKDINMEMSNVSLKARILKVFPIREYTTKEGKKGKHASLIIGDRTGKMRLVVWDPLAEQTLEMQKGQMLQINRAYPKLSIQGDGIELHVGYRGSLEILPDEADTVNYPLPETKIYKIDELQPDLKEVDLEAKVKSVEEKREFQRENGQQGLYRRVQLTDGRHTLTMVMWGSHANLGEQMEPGDTVIVENGYTKPGYQQKEPLELHAGNYTRIKILKKAT